ncbi:hypothetical protein QTP88_029521 [Uroleucon formosanum]
MSLSCSKCNKVFGYHWNLKTHENKCSIIVQNENNNLIKCPDSKCEYSFTSYALLRKHVEDFHSVVLNKEQHCFKTLNEFMEWKQKIEKECVCSYVSKATARLKKGKRTYYYCHRSGYFKTKSQGIRRIKSQGSNKIDSTCTSSMVVTEDTNGISVNYCSTHFGHGSNLGRCRLTADERAMIAGSDVNLKNCRGVTFSKILDDVRNNVHSIYDVTTLISKRDLRNVERDFNLVEGKDHSSDFVSVCIWIERMNNLSEEENPIIYSCLENEDLFLIIATKFQLEMLQKFGNEKICVDSTHSTTEYDLLLTSLVIVDEFGNAFPCCFCFTKKKDTKTWTTFFTKVKEKTGIITTKTFMSDDDPSFYNAWRDVMGDTEHKLLCSWHVDQSWRKQVQAKIKGSYEKKTYVYKTLKILQHEPNTDDFEKLLTGICEELKNDEDTNEFHSYFQSNYLNRVEQWAYCHRRLCGINTNMYLESIHKTIKYFYLNGRKNKRMDQCINALLKFIRDKMFERFIKLSKNKYSAKEDNILASHNIVVKILDDVKIERVSETTWRIDSTTEKNLTYDVSKVQDICDTDNCKLKCRLCNICTHIFICECPDFIIRSNICKHIHLIVQSEKDFFQTVFTQPVEPIKNVDTLEKVLVNQENIEPIEKEKKLIIEKLMVSVGLLKSSDYSIEECTVLKHKVDSLLDTIRGKKRKLTDTTNCEPSNKKIEKQFRVVKKKTIGNFNLKHYHCT